MLPIHLVNEIKRLLDEGKSSQRKIAKQLGVARGTVQAIASGRRGLYGRETPSQGDCPCSDAPAERCPGCGMLVVLPCVYCRTVAFLRRKKRLSDTPSPVDSPRRAA